MNISEGTQVEGAAKNISSSIQARTKTQFTLVTQAKKVTRVKCISPNYNGTTDPKDHTIGYSAILDIINHTDAKWCRNFATTHSAILDILNHFITSQQVD